ncbi:sigma-54-dependent Fis family transcriptional regulator [Ectothiorhodospiraceae bacterium 2226]|nr:sigma-54-dependent Fis family transcriptional regulator [Ectothiorhodospiraceae bacterium 2226]
MGRILIVEPDCALRGQLVRLLESAGMQIIETGDLVDGVARAAAGGIDAIVNGLPLGGGCLRLLEYARPSGAPACVVLLPPAEIAAAAQVLSAGAYDCLCKPLDLDRLPVHLHRAVEHRRLQAELARYRSLVGGNFHGMIGRSPPMQRLFDEVRRVAKATGPALVSGESGTGKELVARALHSESERRDRPFVAVNCAGVPAELLESEFFGHAAGAFTGAQQARRGLFAQAVGGTLLLDEISEMPLALQAKLLRILQEGAVRPLGSEQEYPVDVRVVAATNRDLEAEVRAGRFRDDLYYRLETFHMHVPPLRERGEDVELLAGVFVARHAEALGRTTPRLGAAVLERLHSYDFPGNVRELWNAMERAVVFAPGEEIGTAALPERMRRRGGAAAVRPADADPPLSPSPVPPGLIEGAMLPTLAEVERRYIRYVLEQAAGNKRRAAAMLGIGRRTLYRRLQQPE